ncbi:MAG: DUF2007 domain-containing protein [Acidobacteria bacterium]|jgi:hypothetical protein|nr:DUF2007 domain-containing protein [Acidobacteriota bacterium]
MKKVFVASHPTEAHLVKGLLDSREIPAIVRGESLFGVRGEAPVTPDTLPSVWVNNDDQAEEAVALIRSHGVGVTDANTPGEPWSCSGCGEVVEAQFGECWKCGAAK